MPYQIIHDAQGCKGYAVVKQGSRIPIQGGCHPTRSEAVKHLVALRVNYEGREQPRDSDGKFASIGGGKSKGKGKGKGKQKSGQVKGGGKQYGAGKQTAGKSADIRVSSKIKDCPQGVMKHGVNERAEFVESPKTGNIFRNPKYNGAEEGRGKSALAGDKEYDPHTALNSWPPSQYVAPQLYDKDGNFRPESKKYLETGQAKYMPAKEKGGSKDDKSGGKKGKGKQKDETGGKPNAGGKPDVDTPAGLRPPPAWAAKAAKDTPEMTDAKEWKLLSEQEQYGQSLDTRTIEVLESYSQSGYKSINKAMRGAPPPPQAPEAIVRGRRNGKIIDDAIRGAPPTSTEMVVYRGVDMRALGVDPGALGGGPKVAAIDNLVGKTFIDRGIVSTSIDAGVSEDFGSMRSGDFQLVVRIPAGSQALGMGDISLVPDESEVLLPAGTRFTVTGVDRSAGGVIKVFVEADTG